MTTELEAVNIILSTIGQVPVLAVASSPLADSKLALDVLNEISEQEQSPGYDFNSAENVEKIPDGSGFVDFTSDVIMAKAYYAHQRFDLRSSRLYDLIKKTDVFTFNPRVNTISIVAFESLPRPLQRYVNIKAARTYANRYIGSPEQNGFNAEDESFARTRWLSYVAKTSELNVMSSWDSLRPQTFRPVDTITRFTI